MTENNTEVSKSEKHPFLQECIDLYNIVNQEDIKKSLPFFKHHIGEAVLKGQRHAAFSKAGNIQLYGKVFTKDVASKAILHLKNEEGFELTETNDFFTIKW